MSIATWDICIRIAGTIDTIPSNRSRKKRHILERINSDTNKSMKKQKFDEKTIFSRIYGMIPSLQELKDQALCLPASDREKLASVIMGSTHNQELSGNDRDWLFVAESRYNDLKSGKDSGTSENHFFTQVEERLG